MIGSGWCVLMTNRGIQERYSERRKLLGKKVVGRILFGVLGDAAYHVAALGDEDHPVVRTTERRRSTQRWESKGGVRRLVETSVSYQVDWVKAVHRRFEGY